MYTPQYAQNNKIDEVKDFIKANSFGILVSQLENKIWATHIPLELDKNAEGKEVLFGHISRANPQWKNFTNDGQVMCIFNGSNSYISSSWYNHENVPTWNYIAVHIYGKIKIIEGEEFLSSLKRLVDKYEAGSKKPMSVEKMSQEYIQQTMKGIVGFEISIDEIHSTYKLSQNRDEINHANIITELEKKGDINSLAIAEEMKKHKKQ